MRQEHVTLYDVRISQLYDRIKEYLKELKLDIIHEEKDEDYWDIKAHKGGKGSVIVGNVSDVEILISGARSAVPYYDVILRTGAWGKDIVVPTAIAAAATAGIAAAPVAAIEAYRAHSRRSSGNLLVQQYIRYRKKRCKDIEPCCDNVLNERFNRIEFLQA